MIYPLMTVKLHDFPLSQCVNSQSGGDATLPQGPEEVNRIGRPGDDVNHCDPAWIRWIRCQLRYEKKRFHHAMGGMKKWYQLRSIWK